MTPLQEWTTGLVLVMARVGMFVATFPLFRSLQIPRLVKVSLTLSLSILWLTDLAGATGHPLPTTFEDHWLSLTVGDHIDYDNDRAGKRRNLHAGFWYRFGRHLLVEPRATIEKMKVDEGWLYNAKISEVTTTWQFTARTFFRAIVQHVDYEYHSTPYSDARDGPSAVVVRGGEREETLRVPPLDEGTIESWRL